MKLTTALGCAALAAGFGALASAQTNSYPFQDPNLPLEERVNNVVSLLTLDEKVAFFSSRPGVPRLGIRPMGHVEGLHGLARGGPSNWGRRNPIPTTIFPQAYGLGETWDPEILRQAAAVEGYETRYIAQNPKYGGRGGLIVRSEHEQSALEHPAEELRGFRRVALQPGETKTVEILLTASSLAYWDTGKHRFVVEPGSVELRVGASSADIRLKQTIKIVPAAGA